MPGNIQVSVLEAFDLPAAATDGKYVSIKVSVGKREFQTDPSEAESGKTTQWNSNFTFPVLNLRDNLVVMLVGCTGDEISKNEIDTPSIVEKGFWEEVLLLHGGGSVHLRLSFLLTEEERRRIDVMRAAALNRKEQEISKLLGNDQSFQLAGSSVSIQTMTGNTEALLNPSRESMLGVENTDEVDSVNSRGPILDSQMEGSVKVIMQETPGTLVFSDAIEDTPEDSLPFPLRRVSSVIAQNDFDDKKNTMEFTGTLSSGHLVADKTDSGSLPESPELKGEDIATAGTCDFVESSIYSSSNGAEDGNKTSFAAAPINVGIHDGSEDCKSLAPQISKEASISLTPLVHLPAEAASTANTVPIEQSMGPHIESLQIPNSRLSPNTVKDKVKAYEKSFSKNASHVHRTFPSQGVKILGQKSAEGMKYYASKNLEGGPKSLAEEKGTLNNVTSRKQEDRADCSIGLQKITADGNRHVKQEVVRDRKIGDRGPIVDWLQQDLVPDITVKCLNNIESTDSDVVSKPLEQFKGVEYNAYLEGKENRYLNSLGLLNVAKQVLGGVVMIAVGVVIWGANSNRRSRKVKRGSN